MRLVLDTNVLVADWGDVTFSTDAEVAISVASLSELHFGVLVARTAGERGRRLRRLAAIENRFDALGVTSATARTHGELLAAVHAMGRQPRRRSMDLLIAATAAEHGASLVTRNVDDFVGLEELLPVVHPDALSQ